MKKNDFVIRLSEYCEFENNNLTLDSLFKSIEGFDSLAIMSIIAFVDEYFNKTLKASQLQEITDFNSLILLIGVENFDND